MQESSQSPQGLKPHVENGYSLLGHRYHHLNGTGHLAHATSREYLH